MDGVKDDSQNGVKDSSSEPKNTFGLRNDEEGRWIENSPGCIWRFSWLESLKIEEVPDGVKDVRMTAEWCQR